MRFGSRAKLIKNKPKVNEERSIAEYKQLLAEAEAKIREQNKIIAVLKDGKVVQDVRPFLETIVFIRGRLWWWRIWCDDFRQCQRDIQRKQQGQHRCEFGQQNTR